MAIILGLVLSFASAVAVNWAYTREHDAAGSLPPLSARQPITAVTSLIANKAWRVGFAAETGGWLVYLAALRLAPLALVQTVGAAGIGVLAFIQSGGRLSRLRRHERLAAVVVVAGLALLGLSLAGTTSVGHQPPASAVLVWLGASAGAAALVTLVQTRLTRAVAYGLGAGLLFAIGDISAKLAVHGGVWLIVVLVLIPAYAFGSIELQTGFQHGDALTAAGMATLATNAVPIAAGVVLFHEAIPHGTRGVLQVAAFATLVVGATLLDHRDRPRSGRRPRST